MYLYLSHVLEFMYYLCALACDLFYDVVYYDCQRNAQKGTIFRTNMEMSTPRRRAQPPGPGLAPGYPARH